MPGSAIDVRTPDGVADTYLSRPDGDARRPGVLLLIDAFGLRPQIERMADRIAARGHVVLAPNTLYRGGRAPVVSTEGLDDPARRAEVFERVVPLIQALTPERIAADARAYLDRLGELAAGPCAIVGYCMGGRVGWRVATAFPERVAALACFHTGDLVTDAADSPHRSAAQLTSTELYLGFADQDATMPADDIAVVEQALGAAGVVSRAEVYAGARHGYTMADTPAYDERAAERHYAELFSVLERAGTATRG